MRELEMNEIECVAGGECAGPMTTESKIELGIVFLATGVVGAGIWLWGYSHTC